MGAVCSSTNKEITEIQISFFNTVVELSNVLKEKSNIEYFKTKKYTVKINKDTLNKNGNNFEEIKPSRRKSSKKIVNENFKEKENDSQNSKSKQI